MTGQTTWGPLTLRCFVFKLLQRKWVWVWVKNLIINKFSAERGHGPAKKGGEEGALRIFTWGPKILALGPVKLNQVCRRAGSKHAWSMPHLYPHHHGAYVVARSCTWPSNRPRYAGSSINHERSITTATHQPITTRTHQRNKLWTYLASVPCHPALATNRHGGRCRIIDTYT